MIKYFLKDNFCLFIYKLGSVASHSGPDAKKRPAVKAVLANQIAPFSWIKNKLVLWPISTQESKHRIGPNRNKIKPAHRLSISIFCSSLNL